MLYLDEITVFDTEDIADGGGGFTPGDETTVYEGFADVQEGFYGHTAQAGSLESRADAVVFLPPGMEEEVDSIKAGNGFRWQGKEGNVVRTSPLDRSFEVSW